MRSSEDLLLTRRHLSIACVGNGTPRVANGSMIDRFDVVIRFNNYRLAPYEHLVGVKTTWRCTSGWGDIERRVSHPEFSPFRADAPQSLHIPWYTARQPEHPLRTAEYDIRLDCLKLGIQAPSTGFACLLLCAALAMSVTIFNFDGFLTPPYWTPDAPVISGHSRDERVALKTLIGMQQPGAMRQV